VENTVISPIRISASLASAPLNQLDITVNELELSGADSLHFDIEDGSFVPAMTLGTKVISDLRPITSCPFEVHLMVTHPEWLVPCLAKMGVNRIAVHYEVCSYPRRLLREISSIGIQAGLAFNPATPLPDLAYLRPYLSFIFILTSEPEMANPVFLPEMSDKVKLGKVLNGLEGVDWIVDGGIKPENIPQIQQSGVDAVVVGRAIFADGRITDNLRALRNAALYG
jgi:ribulose-phosphate 3-epimerase